MTATVRTMPMCRLFARPFVWAACLILAAGLVFALPVNRPALAASKTAGAAKTAAKPPKGWSKERFDSVSKAEIQLRVDTVYYNDAQNKTYYSVEAVVSDPVNPEDPLCLRVLTLDTNVGELEASVYYLRGAMGCLNTRGGPAGMAAMSDNLSAESIVIHGAKAEFAPSEDTYETAKPLKTDVTPLLRAIPSLPAVALALADAPLPEAKVNAGGTALLVRLAETYHTEGAREWFYRLSFSFVTPETPSTYQGLRVVTDIGGVTARGNMNGVDLTFVANEPVKTIRFLEVQAMKDGKVLDMLPLLRRKIYPGLTTDKGDPPPPASWEPPALAPVFEQQVREAKSDPLP